MGKLLVVELISDVEPQEREELNNELKKRLELKESDTVFLICRSNRNNVYFVSDSWFTKLINSFRLRRLLKKLIKENEQV